MELGIMVICFFALMIMVFRLPTILLSAQAFICSSWVMTLRLSEQSCMRE